MGKKMIMAAAVAMAIAAAGCGDTKSKNKEMNKDNLGIEKGVEAGLSGMFAGALNDTMIVVAGGCNFPENPLGADSKKHFYEGVYLVNPADGTMQRCGSLPMKMAYGATATTKNGLLLIGGADAEKSIAGTWLLTIAEGRASLSDLPALPVTIDNAAAAAIDAKVYVAGGSQDGKPGRGLYMLDMDDMAAGWRKIADMPGNARVQPVMAAAKDAAGDDCLWIWGGFAGRYDGNEPTLELTGLKYVPQSETWSELPPLLDTNGEAVSVGGGAAATLSDGRIAIIGGVNKDIFIDALRNQAPDYLEHPKEWYRFNGKVLIYDPMTGTNSALPYRPELARAGASAVAMSGSRLAVTGGELKPRIRTAQTLLLGL